MFTSNLLTVYDRVVMATRYCRPQLRPSLSSARGGRVTTSFLLKKNKIKGPEAPAGRGRGGGVAREGAASQGAARLRGRARVAGVDVARGGHPQEQDAPRAQHHVQHPPELARHHHPHHQARIRRGPFPFSFCFSSSDLIHVSHYWP